MRIKLLKDLLKSINQARTIHKNQSVCLKCKRETPNQSFKTENGCLWCDSKYYLKGEKK